MIISYYHAIQACYHSPIFLRHYFMPVNFTPLHPTCIKKPSTHVFPTNARFIPLSRGEPFEVDRFNPLSLHPSSPLFPFRRLNDVRGSSPSNFHSSPRASLPLILPVSPRRNADRTETALRATRRRNCANSDDLRIPGNLEVVVAKHGYKYTRTYAFLIRARHASEDEVRALPPPIHELSFLHFPSLLPSCILP